MSGSRGTGREAVVPRGRLLCDEHVPAALSAVGVTPDEMLRRHQAGDWGMAVTSTFMFWPEGKALSVFGTTAAKITYVFLV